MSLEILFCIYATALPSKFGPESPITLAFSACHGPLCSRRSIPRGQVRRHSLVG